MASSHYSKAQNISELNFNCAAWATHIMKMCNKRRRNWFPILCYRGMSGIASATAVAMQMHLKDPEFAFGMVYVRKEDEDSHGSDLEMNGIEDVPEGKRRVLVFVDDFICGGTTRRHCMHAITKMMDTDSDWFKSKYAMIIGLKPVGRDSKLKFVLVVLTNNCPRED